MIASGRHTANRYGWTALIAALAITQSAYGQSPAVWKVGAPLDAQLKQSLSVHFAERPLRAALQRLQSEFGVAIFLDRRLNPDQVLTLAASDLPLSQVIEQLAQQAAAPRHEGAAACRLGAVTYLGPTRTASQLPGIAAARRADANRLPANLRTALMKSAPLAWPELTEPRTLVEKLASEAGLRLASGEAIPHDLWPAVELPPLPLADQLSLVLAGFDLTYAIEASQQRLALAPWPANSVEPARSSQPSAARTKSTTSPKPSKSPGQSLYSLRASGQAAGNVLKTIAQSLNKELAYEPALLEQLRRPVTFDLKNVPLEQLLETTLASSGLSYEITDSQLRVKAAD